jgi:8-oxo-dGTP pyrophosphatase MutT (NUDIX family)
MIEVAGILIQNIDGDFLMCHPTNHPDVWSLPKGHIESGETPMQAAIRETIEETNIDISKLNGTILFLTQFSYNISGNKTKNLHVFLFKSNIDLKKLDLDIKCISSFTTKDGSQKLEMDKHEWFSYDEVTKKGMLFMKNIFTLYKKELINQNI